VIEFLVTFWKPLALIIIIATLATAVGVAKHNYDERRRDEGRAEVQAKWDADKKVRIERTTAIVNLWDKERQRADASELDHDRMRTALFGSVEDLRRNIPPVDRDRSFPASGVRVLNSAVVAANTDTPSTPGQPVKNSAPAQADSTVGAVVEWGVGCATQYAACRDQVGGLIDFYNNLRKVPQ
jgi:hypothetical protein